MPSFGVVVCLSLFISCACPAPAINSGNLSVLKLDGTETKNEDLRRLEIEESMEYKEVDNIIKHLLLYLKTHISGTSLAGNLKCETIKGENGDFVFYKLKGKLFPKNKPIYVAAAKPTVGFNKYFEISGEKDYFNPTAFHTLMLNQSQNASDTSFNKIKTKPNITNFLAEVLSSATKSAVHINDTFEEISSSDIAKTVQQSNLNVTHFGYVQQIYKNISQNCHFSTGNDCEPDSDRKNIVNKFTMPHDTKILPSNSSETSILGQSADSKSNNPSTQIYISVTDSEKSLFLLENKSSRRVSTSTADNCCGESSSIATTERNLQMNYFQPNTLSTDLLKTQKSDYTTTNTYYTLSPSSVDETSISQNFTSKRKITTADLMEPLTSEQIVSSQRISDDERFNGLTFSSLSRETFNSETYNSRFFYNITASTLEILDLLNHSNGSVNNSQQEFSNDLNVDLNLTYASIPPTTATNSILSTMSSADIPLPSAAASTLSLGVTNSSRLTTSSVVLPTTTSASNQLATSSAAIPLASRTTNIPLPTVSNILLTDRNVDIHLSTHSESSGDKLHDYNYIREPVTSNYTISLGSTNSSILLLTANDTSPITTATSIISSTAPTDSIPLTTYTTGIPLPPTTASNILTNVTGRILSSTATDSVPLTTASDSISLETTTTSIPLSTIIRTPLPTVNASIPLVTASSNISSNRATEKIIQTTASAITSTANTSNIQLIPANPSLGLTQVASPIPLTIASTSIPMAATSINTLMNITLSIPLSTATDNIPLTDSNVDIHFLTPNNSSGDKLHNYKYAGKLVTSNFTPSLGATTSNILLSTANAKSPFTTATSIISSTIPNASIPLVTYTTSIPLPTTTASNPLTNVTASTSWSTATDSVPLTTVSDVIPLPTNTRNPLPTGYPSKPLTPANSNIPSTNATDRVLITTASAINSTANKSSIQLITGNSSFGLTKATSPISLSIASTSIPMASTSSNPLVNVTANIALSTATDNIPLKDNNPDITLSPPNDSSGDMFHNYNYIGEPVTSNFTISLGTTTSSILLSTANTTSPLTTATSIISSTAPTASIPLTTYTTSIPLSTTTASNPLTNVTDSVLSSIATDRVPLTTGSDSIPSVTTTNSIPLRTIITRTPLPTVNTSIPLATVSSNIPSTNATDRILITTASAINSTANKSSIQLITGNSSFGLTKATSPISLSIASTSIPMDATSNNLLMNVTASIALTTATDNVPLTATTASMPLTTTSASIALTTTMIPLPTVDASDLIRTSNSTMAAASTLLANNTISIPPSTHSIPLTITSANIPTTAIVSIFSTNATDSNPLASNTTNTSVPTTTANNLITNVTASIPLTTVSDSNPLGTTTASISLPSVTTGLPLTTATHSIPVLTTTNPIPVSTANNHNPLMTATSDIPLTMPTASISLTSSTTNILPMASTNSILLTTSSTNIPSSTVASIPLNTVTIDTQLSTSKNSLDGQLYNYNAIGESVTNNYEKNTTSILVSSVENNSFSYSVVPHTSSTANHLASAHSPVDSGSQSEVSGETVNGDHNTMSDKENVSSDDALSHNTNSAYHSPWNDSSMLHPDSLQFDNANVTNAYAIASDNFHHLDIYKYLKIKTSLPPVDYPTTNKTHMFFKNETHGDYGFKDFLTEITKTSTIENVENVTDPLSNVEKLTSINPLISSNNTIHIDHPPVHPTTPSFVSPEGYYDGLNDKIATPELNTIYSMSNTPVITGQDKTERTLITSIETDISIQVVDNKTKYLPGTKNENMFNTNYLTTLFGSNINAGKTQTLAPKWNSSNLNSGKLENLTTRKIYYKRSSEVTTTEDRNYGSSENQFSIETTTQRYANLSSYSYSNEGDYVTADSTKENNLTYIESSETVVNIPENANVTINKKPEDIFRTTTKSVTSIFVPNEFNDKTDKSFIKTITSHDITTSEDNTVRSSTGKSINDFEISTQSYETMEPFNNFTFLLPTTDYLTSYLPVRVHPLIVFSEIN